MLHRRFATVTLSLMMMLAAASPAPAAGRAFTDVAGHWAGSHIAAAAAQGLASGYPDGTFRPDGSMTRAEFVTLAVRSRGLAAVPGTGGFSDLGRHWLNAQGYIEAAVQAGLIVTSDYGNPPQFGPDQRISRREVAVIASRALGRQAANWSLRGAPLPYSDADSIPYWATGSVAVARSTGVLSGYPDGSFSGERTITRAEAVVVAGRLAAKRDQVEVPVWEGNSWRVDSPALPFTEASGFTQVTAAPDGTVYYQFGSDVWQIPTVGAPRLFLRDPNRMITAIAAAPDGLFVGQGNRVLKATAPGQAAPWVGGENWRGEDGQGEAAGLNDVRSLCMAADGDLIIVEGAPGRIRRVSAERRVRTLIANKATDGPTPADGPAGQATILVPGSCAADRAGNVYFADHYPGPAVRRLGPDGSIERVAGYRPWWGYADGTNAEARFASITGIAVDDWGNIWVADGGAQRIRRVSPDGHVHTVAGSGYDPQPHSGWLAGADVDGVGTQARFNSPSGIALARGKLYVSQSSGVPLRVVTGDRAVYPAQDVAALVPVAFGTEAERYDPIPLPGEFPALPLALYTPVVDVALIADGVLVHRSAADAGAAPPALSPLWSGQRPGTFRLTLSVGLPDGRRVESPPVTGKAD